MYQPILFPDAELWACGYLRPLLISAGWTGATAVHVGNAVPNPRLPRMVVVRRDGGPRSSLVVDQARLTVRVWAETEKQCADLSGVVRALIGAALNDDAVRNVRESAGPSPIPDESGQPCRLMSFDIALKGTPL